MIGYYAISHFSYVTCNGQENAQGGGQVAADNFMLYAFDLQQTRALLLVAEICSTSTSVLSSPRQWLIYSAASPRTALH